MIIEGDSPAECWLNILRAVVDGSGKEISPLIARINNTDSDPDYREALETDLNVFLAGAGEPNVETTAGTIFPVSLSGGKGSIFERYEKIWKHVGQDRRNRRGTYFNRLVSWGNRNGESVNQLKKIIETYNGIEGIRNPVHRRSALIASVFDPRIDHTPQPQLGFPCLQQVCFVPRPKDGTMQMNAIYAMQYLSNRAYGNYVGLMRLGRFLAGEIGLELSSLNCMISTLSLGEMNKGEAKAIIEKYS